MNSNLTKRGMAPRFAAAVAVGLLTLGASGIASADDDDRYRGYRNGGDRHVKVIHHYDNRGYHPGRGHYKRPKQVVHVYHYQPRVIERHVVVERPVYERHVVVEQPRQYYGPAPQYYGPAPRSYGGGSQLNAGALRGAAIGGLLGSQVGGGSGQLAATAAGTIGGFLLGDHTTRGYR
jgi:hypothetical protein